MCSYSPRRRVGKGTSQPHPGDVRVICIPSLMDKLPEFLICILASDFRAKFGNEHVLK